VFEFLAHQRGNRSVVRLADRESGLSARTIARRLSSVSGLYAYLVARGDTPVLVNPVPRGLMTRRHGETMRSRMAPLVRVPRTLPRILSPQEADRLVGALRTYRDRAMVPAMLLAGLRRCEVLGLRLEDVQVADRRLAVVEGKGGHHRVVPAANRYLRQLGTFLAPASVEAADNALRQLARWMVADSALAAVGDIRHDDIEASLSSALARPLPHHPTEPATPLRYPPRPPRHREVTAASVSAAQLMASVTN
jgi:integrase/recombinase XerD